MRKELQDKLFQRYPRLFRKPHLRPFSPDTGDSYLVDETGPIDERGIECRDGWFHIVDRLSDACEQEIDMQVLQGGAMECWPRVAQIKERFGTLRFYVSGQLSDELQERIRRECSEDGESARTCVCCGKPKMPADHLALYSHCDSCGAKRIARRQR